MGKKNVPRSRLLDRTVDLLRNRPRTLTLQMVSADTGLHTRWLHILLNREGLSPSVDAVVVLYEYLTKSKLPVK